MTNGASKKDETLAEVLAGIEYTSDLPSHPRTIRTLIPCTAYALSYHAPHTELDGEKVAPRDDYRRPSLTRRQLMQDSGGGGGRGGAGQNGVADSPLVARVKAQQELEKQELEQKKDGTAVVAADMKSSAVAADGKKMKSGFDLKSISMLLRAHGKSGRWEIPFYHMMKVRAVSCCVCTCS
jgi:hypothetical protein